MSVEVKDDRKLFFAYYFMPEKREYTELKLYVVMEECDAETDWYCNVGAIQGMARLGWGEGSNWFDAGLREGETRDKALVMREQAQEIARGMGLDVGDAHDTHITDFANERGYPPTMLPTDHNYIERIKRAKARP